MDQEKIKILNVVSKYEALKNKELEYEKKRSFWKGVTVAMSISVLVYVWFQVL